MIPAMSPRLKMILLAVSLGLSGWVFNAQAADYTVELVIYANLQRDNGAEQWAAPRMLPDTEHSLTLGMNGTRMLDGTRSLQAIADTFRRSQRHRLLLHWFWQQPGWGPGQAQPVHVQIPSGSSLPVVSVPAEMSKLAMQQLRERLSTPTAPPQLQQPLLDGTVNLITGEVLQVDVDLLYPDPDTGVPLQLKESRRLRSGELHYLDHPRFGVLLQVAPAGATP